MGQIYDMIVQQLLTNPYHYWIHVGLFNAVYYTFTHYREVKDWDDSEEAFAFIFRAAVVGVCGYLTPLVLLTIFVRDITKKGSKEI